MKSVLPRRSTRQAFMLLMGICVLAFLDVFSLAAMLPIVRLMLDTSVIHANDLWRDLYVWSGFEQETHLILAAVFFVLGLLLLKNWIGLGVLHFQSRFIYDVASTLSERSLRHYYRKDFATVSNRQATAPVRDVLLHPVEFSVYVLLAVMTLLSELAVVFLIMTALGFYSLELLGILTLILGPPLAVVATMKRKRMTRVNRLSDKLKAISLKYLRENIDSHADVRLYGKEAFFIRRFLKSQQNLNRHFSLIHTLGLIPPRVMEVATGLAMAAILLYGLLLFSGTHDVLFVLFLTMATAYRIVPAMNRMVNAAFNIRTYQHTRQVLDPKDSTSGAYEMPDALHEPFTFRDYFSFENVSFRASDNPSSNLITVSFMARKGELIGLYGRPGSGQEEVGLLLLRFYREQSGRIVVDDKPLLFTETRAWQRILGYIRRNPFILDGTLAENIAFGEERKAVDRERVSQAAKDAGLQAYLADQPHGLDTVVGEGGVRTSQEHKQRIALARALYRDAQILLFDDTNPPADAIAHREIMATLSTLSQSAKTILIIANRADMLKNCDRIYAFENGEINQVCRYEDLAPQSHAEV